MYIYPDNLKSKAVMWLGGLKRFGYNCGMNADFHISSHTDGNYDTTCSYGRICGVIDKA